MTARAAMLLLAAAFTLGACGEREPVRIGFLGGLTGRAADLAEGGRNGVQIAVDEINAAGGIHGRPVELIVRDDGQDPATAIAAANALIAGRVEGIVGPMTSAMADVVGPIAAREGVVLVSPSVTARKFFTVDDNLFLVMSSTREEALLSAEYHHREGGVRHVVVFHDTTNRSYTESFLAEFSGAFQQQGGTVTPLAFASAPDMDVGKLVRAALAKRPDAVLLIANSVDAARFAQKIREANQAVVLFASQWATTDRLVELGGKAVEGMFLHSYFGRDSTSPDLIRLRTTYIQRFRREPGFAGVAAYDATRALLGALARRSGNETLHQALLTKGPFPGAETSFSFDRFGDSSRVPRITVVRDGQFVTVR
jgi:branched-chain amino acid transport system substrate-binding protein